MGNLHRCENRRRNAIGVENRTTCNQSGRRSKLLALDRFIARKLLTRVAAPKTETMTPRPGVELLEEDGRAPHLRTPNKASNGTRDRSEEQPSELQSIIRHSYDVFSLK